MAKTKQEISELPKFPMIVIALVESYVIAKTLRKIQTQRTLIGLDRYKLLVFLLNRLVRE